MVDSLRVPGSSQRPPSSLSGRSISRASQRPFSRASQFSVTKQPRLAALLQTLVKQVGNTDEEDDIQHGVDIAIRRIDALKQSSVQDFGQIDAQFAGHILKARINLQDTLAKLLQQTYKTLKTNVQQRRDFDMEIKSNILPAHLQFLLSLSNPPTDDTLSKAEEIMTKKTQSPISETTIWQAILKEEPYEGDHWADENLNESSEDEVYLSDILGSDSSTSSIGGEPSSPSSTAEIPVSVPMVAPSETGERAGRAVVEKLSQKQYWGPSWTPDLSPWDKFDMARPSIIGPTMDSLTSGIPLASHPNIYLNEVDAVREILMLLQGCRSTLFVVMEDGQIEVSTDRRIAHITLGAQTSILSWFAACASTLQPLRTLVENTVLEAVPSKVRTFEAFANGIFNQLRQLNTWCASKEEEICVAEAGESPSHVVSLLSLKRDVSNAMGGIFEDLVKIVSQLETLIPHSTPSIVAAAVLNSLWSHIKSRIAINDFSTAWRLLDVWRMSGEPTWANLHRWIKDGIPIQADIDGHPPPNATWQKDEFFVRINPLIHPGSPDFWEASYRLPAKLPGQTDIPLNGNSDGDLSPYPLFLVPFTDDILAAGKAVGLLRAIGLFRLFGDNWLLEWKSLAQVTSSLSLQALDTSLSDAMAVTLVKTCKQPQGWLHKVLVEECQLWKHLQGLENVCLMVRGDAMSQFSEKLFSRMDTRQAWNDFHFLNTAFREVAILGQTAWIDSSFVRFGFRGPKDRNVNRTVRAIEGLTVEYCMPFPVTYLFGQESIAGYSALFTFLLQLKRAKSILDQVFIRRVDDLGLKGSRVDVKVFYVLRGRLLWFVNAIWNFIMTNVIHLCLTEFHGTLRSASSLDEMIGIHHSHLDKLLGRCMLQPKTAALHRAILSILDLCLQFNECLTAFTADTSADISRHSLILMNRRRRRRRGNRSRVEDMIGFAETLPPGESDSDSDESDEDEENPIESPAGGSFSVSIDGGDFSVKVERIGQELDGLVRFISRGVESLAAGTGDSAPIFGMLAFSLEDWER